MKSTPALYKEREPGINTSLRKLSRIVDPKFGLVESLERIRQYYDEPKFWNFSVTINSQYSKNDGRDFDSQASGYSFFSKEEALLKCLGETLERYCNFVFLKKSASFTGSFNQIKDKAVNLSLLTGFSKGQLKKQKFKHCRITEKSKFRWTKCPSLINGEFILIPSQLIYLSYSYLEKEPIIYPPISTGVAGGSCLSAALVRAIYEIVERDAFMIFYLNKLQAPRIRLKAIKDKRIEKLLRIVKRYKVEVVSLDITTNLGIPVFISIVIDRTGIGKSVSVGAKSDLNPMKALVGSVSEAFHTRTWLRREFEKNSKKIKPSDLLRHSNLKMRGFLWYPVGAIENLDFWIKSPKAKVSKEENKTFPSGVQLKKLLKIFREIGYDVFYKDLMVSPLRKLNYFVVKVIIPQLQPLYLNENYRLLGGERLYTVPEKLGYKRKTEDELNTYPHPFL